MKNIELTNPVVEPDKKTKEPQTPTVPHRKRKLVPDKWPEETPGPKPKA